MTETTRNEITASIWKGLSEGSFDDELRDLLDQALGEWRPRTAQAPTVVNQLHAAAEVIDSVIESCISGLSESQQGTGVAGMLREAGDMIEQAAEILDQRLIETN